MWLKIDPNNPRTKLWTGFFSQMLSTCQFCEQLKLENMINATFSSKKLSARKSDGIGSICSISGARSLEFQCNLATGKKIWRKIPSQREVASQRTQKLSGLDWTDGRILLRKLIAVLITTFLKQTSDSSPGLNSGLRTLWGKSFAVLDLNNLHFKIPTRQWWIFFTFSKTWAEMLRKSWYIWERSESDSWSLTPSGLRKSRNVKSGQYWEKFQTRGD